MLELSQLQQVKNKQVVILRGNGGRELIRSELIERGALVQYCEVYQRSALTFDGHCKVQDWQQRRVNRIVVTSAEQLSILNESVPRTDHGWLHRQQLLVPSIRIAEIASGMGFHDVKVTGSASNPDLLATILSLSTTG
jgi:uroporphyrinogen-III synthase